MSLMTLVHVPSSQFFYAFCVLFEPRLSSLCTVSSLITNVSALPIYVSSIAETQGPWRPCFLAGSHPYIHKPLRWPSWQRRSAADTNSCTYSPGQLCPGFKLRAVGCCRLNVCITDLQRRHDIMVRHSWWDTVQDIYRLLLQTDL
jgi:hypothetical protein